LLDSLNFFMIEFLVIYNNFGLVSGVIGGFFLFIAVERYWGEHGLFGTYLIPVFLSLFFGPVIHFCAPFFIGDLLDVVFIPHKYLIIWMVGLVLGCFMGGYCLNKIAPKIANFTKNVRLRWIAMRNPHMPIRPVRNVIPSAPMPYEIVDYHRSGKICLGVDTLGLPAIDFNIVVA